MSNSEPNKHNAKQGNQQQPLDPRLLAPKVKEAEDKLSALGLTPVQEPVPPNESLPALLQRTFAVFKSVEPQQKKLDSLEAKHKERLADHERSRKALETKEKELAATERKVQALQKQLDQDKAKDLEHKKELLALQTKAEAGFLEEKTAMLADLEKLLGKLRDDHKKLTEAIETARSNAHSEAQKHREDLLAELAKLRKEEEAKIAKASAQSRSDIEKELAETRRQLLTDQVALQKRAAELAADEAVLAGDQAALQMKVERLAQQKAAHTDDQFQRLTEEKQRVTKERDAYFHELEAVRSLQQAFEGRPATAVLQELRQLRDQRAELQRQLQASPTAADRQRLLQLEQERKTWEEERFELQRKLEEAESARKRLRPSAIALEDAKTEIQTIDTSRRLLQRQVDELKAEVAKYTEADNQHNPLQAFVDFDTNPELNEEVRNTAAPQLDKFTEELRTRLAAGVGKRPPLFYDPRDLRSFVAGMAMSRLILLQGNSGTGKTSLATGAAAAMGGGCAVVSVQAGWRDRQDLLGYYNAFHRRYYQTEFAEALYRAGTPRYRNTPFFIVLDEINLSRVEQFFADFLSALELPDGSNRRIRLMANAAPNPPRLMPDGQHLPIPDNVWFIGTANHDETTTEFADKTYDRAHVLELPRLDGRAAAPNGQVPKRMAPVGIAELQAAFETAQQNCGPTLKKVTDWMSQGSALAKALEEHAAVPLGNRLDMQLKRYLPVVLAMGGSVGEAMDHVLQSRVLRKVRDRHSIQREDLEKLQECLQREWKAIDAGSPKRCLELLAKEIKAKR
jgi:hypothetical protein